MIMSKILFLGMTTAILFLLVQIGYCSIQVKLEHCDTIFFPSDFNETDQVFQLNTNSFRRFAYDEDEMIVVGSGRNLIFVVDVSDPCKLQLLLKEKMDPGFTTQRVEFCGGFFILTSVSINEFGDGRVSIFRFNRVLNELELVNTIAAGNTPLAALPTSDCRKVVVAVSGILEQGPDGNFTDPPGIIRILKFPSGDLTKTPAVKDLDFTAFDMWAEELRKAGVRQTFFENNNPISNDLTPAFVTFNKDESLAYVSLWFNNAIAVVDMIKHKIVDILPVGIKSFKNTAIDTSDMDGGIMLKSRESLTAFRQPRVLDFIHVGNEEFILAVNDGFPVLTVGGGAFFDAVRVGDLDLDTNVFENAEELKAVDNLGRLFVSGLPSDADPDGDGKVEALRAFGSRDISLVDPWDGRSIIDSDDQFESIVARARPDLFNSIVVNSQTVDETFDTTSDDRGPDPQAVLVAEFNGKKVVFVGLEDPGFILPCVVDPSIPLKFQCDNLYSGIPEDIPGDVTWQELYDQRLVKDLDIVELRLVPAETNPTGEPILLVGSRRSSTLSALKIKVEDEGRSTGTTIRTTTSTSAPTPARTPAPTPSIKRPKFRFPKRRRKGHHEKGKRGKGCLRRKARRFNIKRNHHMKRRRFRRM